MGQNINRRHPAIWLATWFGCGFIKPAPGTWGTLGALPFGWAMLVYGNLYVLLAAIVAVCVVGWWAANIFEQQSGSHDSKEIVIDEVAGMWIALIPASADLLWIALAFALFRVFDILKPWTVSYFDKHVGGASGVMADDIAAGILAALVLAGVRYAAFG